MPASLAGLTVPGPLHPVSPPGPPLGTPDPVRSEDPPASWWQASVLPGSGLAFSVANYHSGNKLPLRDLQSHLANAVQPVFFSLVYESMNNKASFSICFEIGVCDSRWICNEFLFGGEKCLMSSF